MSERTGWRAELAAWREIWETEQCEAAERRDRERRSLRALAERQAVTERRVRHLERLARDVKAQVDFIARELAIGVELSESDPSGCW